MISQKIKELREKNGLTQKDLADKLYVTPQAVSRWESGDTEPSASTLDCLARIFGVSLDELFGHDAPQPEVVVKTETVYTAAPPVLGVCKICKKAITDSNDYVETHHTSGRRSITECRCKACDEKLKKQQHDNQVAHSIVCRKRSFAWSTVISVAVLGISLGVTISQQMGAIAILSAAIVSVLLFPFLSCLFLQNNFVEDLFLRVASFGFVKFPGLIFSLDLDGIVWFLTVKLAFWILGFILAVVCIIFALALCMFLSIFVYPFALRKNINHPESSDF